MTSFLERAGQIFEVARQGDEPEDLTIRIDPESGINITSGSDYSCSSGTVYRVRRGQGRVRVEGRSGSETFLLQTEHAKRRLFIDQPTYFLA